MRVLFIGNSYTFYNDMPAQVGALAASDPGAPEITTDRIVEGGASLKKHYLETGARARITEGGFSHLVLQDKSSNPLHDAADFEGYARRLANLAPSAQLLLYETWARHPDSDAYAASWSGGSPAGWMRRVRDAYAKLARSLDAEVVPVGTAWERALARHPSFCLHDDDLHHASPLGSHLSAAVFFAWLTGRDPTPCPFRPEGVDPDEALAVRAVAWDLLRERG